MKNCIFCEIVAGRSPCFKIYEDDLFFAFLDINPRTKGHTLLIPKKHCVWVYEIPDFGKYWQTVLKITRAMQKALSPTYVTYFTYGLEVRHAHIHILARFDGDTGFVPEVHKIPEEEMKNIAVKIKYQLDHPD